MRPGMRGECMEIIFDWIRSLVFYLILMTMVVNLLPDKKYEKYLRLFVGVIFLMLVFSPFINLSGVEARAAEAFSRLTFQNDARALKREITDADGARMAKLVESYRDAIEVDLRQMAEELGMECLAVAISLDEELEGGTFGRVVSVDMTVSGPEKAAQLKAGIGAYYGVEERNIAIHVETE